jgi:hypothetical protein
MVEFVLEVLDISVRDAPNDSQQVRRFARGAQRNVEKIQVVRLSAEAEGKADTLKSEG